MYRGSLLLLMIAGCPGGLGGEPNPFECVLGVEDEAGIHALVAAEPVDMVLGFQGFLFIDLVAQGDVRDGPFEVGMRLEPEGLEPVNTTLTVDLVDGVARDLMLFLEASQLTALSERAATLTVRLESKRDVCVTSANIVLVDGVACDPLEASCDESR